MHEFISLISEPGDIRELRALEDDPASGIKASWGGYYSDPRILAANAVRLSKVDTIKGVYITLNPLKQPLGKLDANSDRLYRAAGNDDIKCRAVIAIDIDPVRPSGVGATDTEKLEARKVADKVLTYLRDRNLPEPMQFDSGSGYHLWLLCDRTTPITSTQVAAFLRSIANACDSDAAHVDCGIANDARILRLPGTMNRKGPHTDERPHRKSKPVHIPATITRLTAAQVEAVAGPITEKARSAKGSVIMPIGEMEDKMEEFIQQYPDHLIVEETYSRAGTTYYKLGECPIIGAAHSDSDVGMGKTCLRVSAAEGPSFVCFGSDCTGNAGGHKQTFGDLCKLLFEETGIKNKVKFMTPDQERAEYEAYLDKVAKEGHAAYCLHVHEQFELIRQERPLLHASIDWDDNFDPSQIPARRRKWGIPVVLEEHMAPRPIPAARWSEATRAQMPEPTFILRRKAPAPPPALDEAKYVSWQELARRIGAY